MEPVRGVKERRKKMTTLWRTPILSILFLTATVATVMADEIRLKNGDRLSGKVVRMEDSKLVFKTSYAGEISINWAEVSFLSTEEPIKVILSDETSLQGITESAEQGKIKLKTSQIKEPVSFDLADVKTINPKPPGPGVKLSGNVNLGLNSTSGNTDTRNIHFDGQFSARTTKTRSTVGGSYNRQEDQGTKTVDNASAYLNFDYFYTQKWFFYGNTTFQKDVFQDLNLRSTFGAGTGYQFFESKEMNLSVSGGLAYVNNDYSVGEDNSFVSAAWAIDFDWYIWKDRIQFFNHDDGFISLESTDDIIIRTRTGFRLPIYENFNTTIQYNLDWNRNPVPGTKSTDEMFILSLGYSFK
jgi:putative salt-induced outer membrane protein YdiY